MKYVITNESKKEAKRIFAAYSNMNEGFNKALDALCVPEEDAKPQPKPFGPGTRLRARNGDELRIVYDKVRNAYGILKDNKYCMEWFERINDLEEYLVRLLGATVIDED